MDIYFMICQKTIHAKTCYYPNKENTFQFYVDIYSPENKPFHKDYFIIYEMIYRTYYYTDTYKHTFHRAKFKMLDLVLKNILFSKEYKETYLALLSKIQKTYFALLKFVRVCKIQKTKLQVDTDLLMNELTNIHDNNKICILQNNSKYLFSLPDLINIIETAITNSNNFFVDALMPKNPYNNMQFSLSTLYNIYFAHKKSTFVLSHLFHLWFLCNFQVEVFAISNEAAIRDFLINKFVYNSTENILYGKIMHMLQVHLYARKLIIHEKFPKKLLVNIMRPFLFCKYMYTYGIMGLEKTQIYKTLLFYKLKAFYEYNKNFGRFQYKLKFDSKTGGKKYVRVFNTEHISYNKIKIDPAHSYMYPPVYESENPRQSNFYERQVETDEDESSSESDGYDSA